MADIIDKRSSERTRLETVIPLETPFELQLAVASSCNFRCTYCYWSDPKYLKQAELKKGVMDFDLYKKIVDDLDEFPQQIKVLRLMREGEPLLNRRFVDMIRYAKEKQPGVKVDTTTNASRLTPELSDQIIDAGLDKIGISLQGMNAETCKTIAGVEADFDQIVENVIYFCEHRTTCKVYIKVPDIGVTESEKKEFFRFFDQYADELFVEHIHPAWPDLDLTDLVNKEGIGYYGQPVHKKRINVCTLPFYDLTIDFKGIVTACAVDWERKSNFGDVNKQSLYEIWNGKKFNDFRRMHLGGERGEHVLCGKCDALEYCGPDIIDDYADVLYEKFRVLS